jgi:hypothetical protein
LVLAWASAQSACNCGSTKTVVLSHQVGSYSVQVTNVTQPDGTPPAFGDGGPDAPYPFPFSDMILHVKAQALDENGQPFTDDNRPAAIRITPGDLDPSTRWLPTTNGAVEGDIQVAHVFGATHVWVLDQLADVVYVDGGELDTGAPDAGLASDGGSPFTHAAGTSQAVYFTKPTLVNVQRQPLCDPAQSFTAGAVYCPLDADQCTDSHGGTYSCFQNTCLSSCDNRLSPLTGDFVTLDVPPPLTDMIVTAITQSGFYVTDLKAEKMSPDSGDPSAGAWDALPSHFGHIFVYTYSAPANLYVGDHLLSLSGSVEEFSGDTQLDFPSWIKVDALPTPDQIPAPYPLTLADCQVDPANPTIVDQLCGYYNSNMDLESLESAPVKVLNVKPSNLFVNCDYNGNLTLPLFVSSKTQFNGWGCYTDDPADYPECGCEIACITGVNQPAADGGVVNYSSFPDGGQIVCSELTGFTSYSQWDVVMPDYDGGYSTNTRISVDTTDALATFNPLDLQLPEHQGITFDISGMLNQVQASRPRWVIQARTQSDVCCHANLHTDENGNQVGTCPNGVPNCTVIGGQ